MFFHKKISSDFFLLVLLVVRLRIDSDLVLNERYIRAPENRVEFLGSSSAYTQITIHSPYSNVLYTHPKGLELNEQDEAAILFNRLNYYNSVRERRSNLLAYYSSSSDLGNPSSIEAPESAASNTTSGESTLPTVTDSSLNSDGTPTENEARNMLIHDLTPEDMDLIEILWKQDIDLGVSREAFDPRSNLEVEKVKEVEYAKDAQDFYVPCDPKSCEEIEVKEEPFPDGNYTIDSETGEFVLDEFSGFNKEEVHDALLDDEPFLAVNQDSYMPFNSDDEGHISNLTDVFAPGEFPELMPENYTDSEFILSQIEDIEKELESYIDNDRSSESVPGDVFSTMEDCWPDSTTMLPLLALGSTHQSSFASFSSRPDNAYPNINLLRPLPGDFVSRPPESFSSILHGSTMEPMPTEETFHSTPASIGPSSVACALAESIATLHNDSDPIPSGSLINTVYIPQIPDVMYSNQTLAPPHNELCMNELFTEEDLQLITMPSEMNPRFATTDHVDSSNDSASLASGRVPSVSDCHDWGDSCSESSRHGENQNYTVPHGRGSLFVQNTELYPQSIPPKRYKHVETNEGNIQEFSRTNFEHSNGNGGQYITIKSEYSDIYESRAGYADSSDATCKKFDYYNVRSPGAVGSDILHHNHSYHLPFSSKDSRYKPILRDKSKSLSEEEASNKDEKRAKELNIPISIDDIINLAIEEYNERLAKYELTDEQLNLIRDIRRRGKNKVAAQNCRKRKMDQISSLQQDLDSMQNEKMQLKNKQEHLLQEKHHIEDKYAQLYQIVSQFPNNKPPGSDLSVHNNNSVTIPTVSNLVSDDDSDHNRGARTKRKFKK